MCPAGRCCERQRGHQWLGRSLSRLVQRECWRRTLIHKGSAGISSLCGHFFLAQQHPTLMTIYMYMCVCFPSVWNTLQPRDRYVDLEGGSTSASAQHPFSLGSTFLDKTVEAYLGQGISPKYSMYGMVLTKPGSDHADFARGVVKTLAPVCLVLSWRDDSSHYSHTGSFTCLPRTVSSFSLTNSVCMGLQPTLETTTVGEYHASPASSSGASNFRPFVPRCAPSLPSLCLCMRSQWGMTLLGLYCSVDE